MAFGHAAVVVVRARAGRRRAALLTLLAGVVVVPALALVVVLGSPAGASGRPGFPSAIGEGTVSGGAFGLSVTTSGAPLLPPTPGGVDTLAAPPAAGFGPIDVTGEVVSVPGLAAVASASASTVGTVAPPSIRTTAALNSASIAGGLVTAGSAASSCTASPGRPRASAKLTGVALAGVTVPVNAAPNSQISVPGVLTAVLNQQIVIDGPGTTTILVRAADVKVLPDSTGGPVLEIVLAESRCAVVTSVVTSPTTGLHKSAPTVPVGPTTVTSPPASGAPVPTTVATASGSLPVLGPATLPPAGPGRQAPKPASLEATTTADADSGPPGVELHVRGSGYLGCSHVIVLFGGSRIGTVTPDSSGRIDHSGFSVPGNEAVGPYRVVAECPPSGRHTAGMAGFRVTEAAVHRSAFVTSVPEPSQVPTGVKDLAATAGVTVVLILTAAFPSELFNSTLDANYDEVRGWFGLGPLASRGDRATSGSLLIFAGFVAVSGVLYSALSPDFGLNRSSVALALGFCLSLVIVTVLFRLPALFVVHLRFHEWAKLRVLPGTAVVAALCVLLSRLLHFQPGYLYGLIAGLSLRHQLAKDTTGRVTWAAGLAILTISVLAWFGRAPLASAAARPHAGFWVILAEACLTTLFVVGLESIVMSMIPVRFLEGGKLTAWSRVAWLTVFGVGVYAFIHILLQPTSGYVADTAGASRFVVIALFVGFGLFSIAFWAYFRFRPARTPAPREVAPAGL